MEIITPRVVKEVWGSRDLDWLYVPSLGAFGGTLMVWNPSWIMLWESELGAYSISICAMLVGEVNEWVFFFWVYGSN